MLLINRGTVPYDGQTVWSGNSGKERERERESEAMPVLSILLNYTGLFTM